MVFCEIQCENCLNLIKTDIDFGKLNPKELFKNLTLFCKSCNKPSKFNVEILDPELEENVKESS